MTEALEQGQRLAAFCAEIKMLAETTKDPNLTTRIKDYNKLSTVDMGIWEGLKENLAKQFTAELIIQENDSAAVIDAKEKKVAELLERAENFSQAIGTSDNGVSASEHAAFLSYLRTILHAISATLDFCVQSLPVKAEKFEDGTENITEQIIENIRERKNLMEPALKTVQFKIGL